jgi:hypothetical protein
MKKANTFYCFSPPVMIATMIIETTMFFYVIYRYKLDTTTRIIAAILVLLAIFQLSEFKVCGGQQAEIFMHIGFVAITILPALGLHLIYRIAQKKNLIVLATSYVVCGIFAITLGLRNSAFLGRVCGGNYSIFTLANKVGGFYYAYYYILLFVGIGLSLYFAHVANKKIRKALLLQVFGYLSFLLPTGIVNTINPKTIQGIPSIMCGFAVIYALILVFGIAPTVSKKTLDKHKISVA